jgi:hypothetical protein
MGAAAAHKASMSLLKKKGSYTGIGSSYQSNRVSMNGMIDGLLSGKTQMRN